MERIVSPNPQAYPCCPSSDPARRFLGSEHDLRIPMVISGPGIKPGSSFEFVASNVDTMPTGQISTEI